MIFDFYALNMIPCGIVKYFALKLKKIQKICTDQREKIIKQKKKIDKKRKELAFEKKSFYTFEKGEDGYFIKISKYYFKSCEIDELVKVLLDNLKNEDTIHVLIDKNASNFPMDQLVKILGGKIKGKGFFMKTSDKSYLVGNIEY